MYEEMKTENKDFIATDKSFVRVVELSASGSSDNGTFKKGQFILSDEYGRVFNSDEDVYLIILEDFDVKNGHLSKENIPCIVGGEFFAKNTFIIVDGERNEIKESEILMFAKKGFYPVFGI